MKDLIISWDIGIRTLSFAISKVGENIKRGCGMHGHPFIVKMVKMIDMRSPVTELDDEGNKIKTHKSIEAKNLPMDKLMIRLKMWLDKYKFFIYNERIQMSLIETQMKSSMKIISYVIHFTYVERNIPVKNIHASVKFVNAPKGKSNYSKRKLISIKTCKKLLEKEKIKNKLILDRIESLGSSAHNITDAILIGAGFIGECIGC